MNKTKIIRFFAVILLAYALFSVFSLSSFAEGTDDTGNDPNLTLSVSASGTVNGDRKIEGSGELHSSSLSNTFNFLFNFK